MRILYFTRDYTPHDHRFLTSLAKTGHEIFSLRLEKRSQSLEDRSLPVEVRQVHWAGGRRPIVWRDYPGLWLDLKRVLKSVRPDVVHAGPVPNVAFLAALSGHHPLVSMSWGSDLLRDIERDANQRRAAHYALRHTDVLIGDCQAVKNKAVQMGFPQERVVLFPWGVDLEKFSPASADEFRQRRGWETAFVLLSARSWEEVYGVDVIARAFVQAARQVEALRLVLLGKGSQAGKIRSILQQGGVEERVFFAGQVNNEALPQIYRAADLYLSASHSDGSSVSLMEALACGLPVLVSDIPGNREWIENSAAGWMFPDGDETALAEKMVKIVRERASLLEAGNAARRLAESRADWNQNFRKCLDAYALAMQVASSRRG